MDFLGLFYRKKNMVDLVGGPGGESPDDLGYILVEETPRHVSTKIMTQFTQLMVDDHSHSK